MITGETLREAFLSTQMEYYFRKKLAPLADDEVALRIEELLKFLTLAVHTAGPIPVSRDIDEVWHYWVLQTMEYAALCRKIPGSIFIHHSSNDYEEFVDPEVKTRASDVTAMLAFLGAYVKNFGPFVADRVRHWPFAGQIMDATSWSLEDLNARLLACIPVFGPDDAAAGPNAPDADGNQRQAA